MSDRTGEDVIEEVLETKSHLGEVPMAIRRRHAMDMARALDRIMDLEAESPGQRFQTLGEVREIIQKELTD